MGINEYGEIYAFDDGAMPKYELRQLPGKPVPFYGLQDVTAIDLPTGTTEEQILDAMSAEANREVMQGYRIFKR